MNRTPVLAALLAAFLAFLVAVPVALADIPSPLSPSSPILAEWTDTPDFQRATVVVIVIAYIVAGAAIYGLWALRKQGANAGHDDDASGER